MAGPQFSLAQNSATSSENRITYFGVTDTRGKHVPFGIKKDDRSKHTYVIGKSGMGKSTMLENMAVQDIQNGDGLCFIDPHGGTAEKLMEYIPEHRVKDVLYFAPFDLQYPISFNVLENVDGDKRHLVVAGLMSAFEKIWVDAWSARMAYILQNTIAALLEFPGATLLGVNRMYIDKEYRKNVIAHVTDPSVRSFWVDEFAKYTDRYAQEATPAIQNKIGQFASNALVRNVIGQEASSFNIRQLMDQRKIFIVNLSKGRVGEGNANLLGSMLITKIYLAAMSRADVSLSEQRALPPFFLFVDEFQNFANKSFAEILSEARKYKLSLTIAHQYIEQMEEEVRAAVFGNVGTMIAFRVGAYDADVLEKEFAPTFEIDDLVNLGARQIYLKLMIDSVSSQPFSATTLPPIPEPEVSSTDRAIAYSRAQYSRPRAEVEQAIREWSERKFEDPEAEVKEAARQERRATRDAEEGRPPRDRAPGTNWNDRERPPRRDDSLPPRDRTERPPQAARPQSNSTRSDMPPRSSGPGPRPMTPRALPPRPAPPRDNERTKNDLRMMLGKISADQKKEPERDVPEKPETENKPLRVENPRPAATLGAPGSQSRVGRDDGKSVTDEGKAQLRNLLANLTKQQPGPTGDAGVAASSVETSPQQATRPVLSQSAVPAPTERTAPHPLTSPASTNAYAAQTAGPPALPADKLKEMLQVERPSD